MSCSWTKHFTLTVPFCEFNAGVTLRWSSIPSRPGRGGGAEKILQVVSCYGNQDELRADGPLGSCADFTFYTELVIVLLFSPLGTI